MHLNFMKVIYHRKILMLSKLNLRWQHKWKKTQVDERPSKFISTLNALLFIKSFYPNLKCLFEIFAIVPMTVATAARSFSPR
jgi:hypothetical protein